ncbi:P-loop containing nucleoside triphosphate hydrolase protein [Lobosporangium transversale]|uniref:p-loop containing nucleoside triphosphate hydrolase protein n=1 Tax=Lobosporangium transversale TaxID=64571 RepID=A0A1Y2GQ08_9FUNG|nr:P-loop containing nucleoside triphosphate hydrolase protein [Lobosporangium transversale]ORZ18328.1 P-loop containing nucleoside triphosphate hydrolase protein [Lobosporangium transversale]|eukprot:XP_021882123.1 P-loop containing nucleoside triphosphate hydrolase protein [Lobosporangium transversale]
MVPISPPTPTKLRPYQQECIDACLSNLQKGTMRQIVSLPVGSGKTVIFSHLMKKVPAPFPGANKTLVLAHRQELLEQTRSHILRNGEGLTVSIDQGKRSADMSADVIVASVPTLGRAGTPRILKYNPKEFKCIIIDEATAESYIRILEHFGAHTPNTHIFVYGCSATVRRHDGLMLRGAFDYISYHKGFITMIEDKWLCGLRVSAIQTEFDLRDVKVRGDDFAQKELSIKVNDPIRNDIVVRSYMTYCAGRKSTVVFAVDIAHLETLAETFRKYGYDARGVSSNTSDEERARLLRDFREQKFPIIVNCGILTEGTDIPGIDCILMARPTKSNVLFLQMLGRGMRLHPGKEDCHVLDFVDIVKGEGLANLPTLLGLDATAISSQEDVDALQKEQITTLETEIAQAATAQYSEETEVVESINPITGHKVARIRVLEYENPYQILNDCSGMPKRLWNMSPNAWVNVGPDTFVLNVQSLSLKIEKSPEDEGGPSRHFMTKATMLPIESDTLQDCLRGVDTWVAKNIGHFPDILGRHARWRKKPASESQLRFLRKLGYDHDAIQDEDEAEVDDPAAKEKIRQLKAQHRPLTKGQAANMITRLTNGAGKWWEQSKKFRIKRAKQLAKEIGVDVGPIPKHIDI